MKEMHTCETYGTQGIDKVGRNRLQWYQLYKTTFTSVLAWL